MRRIVGYNLVLVYRVDYDLAREALPDEAVCGDEPAALLWFQQHHIFGDVAADLDAERGTYSEVVLKIPARLGDNAGNFTVLGLTSSPQLLAQGRLHGIPQQPGRVFMTTLHPGDDEYDRPRSGQRLLFKFDGDLGQGSGSVTLEEESQPAALPFAFGPNLGRRYLRDDVTGRVLLNDLYSGWADDYRASSIWHGRADCDIRGMPGSFLERLSPRDEVRGYFFLSRFSGLRPARGVVHEY